MKFTTVDLDRIDIKDERFRISWFFSLNELESSINISGVLNPPVLIKRGNRLVIVSGWKRVLACLNLALSSIPVFICPDTEELKAFELPVYENLAVREYSQAEKAEIIAKLINFGAEREDILRRFLPLLKIPVQARYIDLYFAAAGFEPELKALLHKKDPDTTILQLLTGLGSEDRTILLPLLEPLGKNKLKELVIDIVELARKEDASVKEMLLRSEIIAVTGKNLTPIQKADNVRKLVKALLNPAQNAWKHAFDMVLKELGVSQGIVISAAPYFEDEDLALNFSFKSREEFLRKLSELKILAGKKEFTGLFNLKSDE